MKDFLRGLIIAAAASAVLLTGGPAGAWTARPGIPSQSFALGSPNKCAKGGGSWYTEPGAGGTHAKFQGGTGGYTAGSDGICNDTDFNLSYDALAVIARIQKWNGSSWSNCRSSFHQTSGSGFQAVAIVEDQVLGCGSGYYRLYTEHRATYNGVNTYEQFNSGAVAL